MLCVSRTENGEKISKKIPVSCEFMTKSCDNTFCLISCLLYAKQFLTLAKIVKKKSILMQEVLYMRKKHDVIVMCFINNLKEV